MLLHIVRPRFDHNNVVKVVVDYCFDDDVVGIEMQRMCVMKKVVAFVFGAFKHRIIP